MKILITYTSMTGRNEKIAKYLADYLEKNDADVALEQIIDTDAYELSEYDAVIVDTYTYRSFLTLRSKRYSKRMRIIETVAVDLMESDSII